MNILDNINMLLEYKNISKAQLARLLNMSPQNLNRKLNAERIDLHFLKKVADVTDTTFNFGFIDNKYKQKLTTKKEKLYDQINGLNETQYKLILDILKNLKNDS